jgi:hypothetical protein
MDNSSVNYWVIRLFDHCCIMQIEFPNRSFVDIVMPDIRRSEITIYNQPDLFNRLLSASVCFDMMPDKSVEHIFNGNFGRFRMLLKIVMRQYNER